MTTRTDEELPAKVEKLSPGAESILFFALSSNTAAESFLLTAARSHAGIEGSTSSDMGTKMTLGEGREGEEGKKLKAKKSMMKAWHLFSIGKIGSKTAGFPLPLAPPISHEIEKNTDKDTLYTSVRDLRQPNKLLADYVDAGQEARFPQLWTLAPDQRMRLKSSFIHFDDHSFCEWMRSLKLVPLSQANN